MTYLAPTRLFAAALSLLALHSAHAQSTCALEDLGTLGGASSFAHDVSADGSVVVGSSLDATGITRAFRWTSSSGMQDIGPGAGSRALAVSANGRQACGSSAGARAFHWDQATGAVDLGTLGVARPTVSLHSLSSDGSTIVGLALGGSVRRAYRWTAATGIVDLGTLGGSRAVAHAVSADGSVVVGESRTQAGVPHAFLWTASTGMQDLGGFLGTTAATFVTPDGSVIAGRGTSQNGGYAFRWTAASGMEVVVAPSPSLTAWVTGLSADGQTVVGSIADGSNGHSFHWTAATGVTDVRGPLAVQTDTVDVSLNASVWATRVVQGSPTRGLTFRVYGDGADLQDLASPSSDTTPTAISADGRTIVGVERLSGSTNRAFRFRGGSEGAIYCQSTANSTSCGGSLTLEGTAVVASNDLSLSVRALPQAAFILFLGSLSTGSSSPPGSVGRLCLGGAIGRFSRPGEIRQADAGGRASLTIDLTDLPTPNGSVSAAPGETWHFQAWHRDQIGGAATSNLSDAIAVTLR